MVIFMDKTSSQNNPLNKQIINDKLHTKIIGKDLIFLDTVSSTNDYLKALADDGCKNGTAVTSREQTKGKGRLGRKWVSEKDQNIILSFMLQPQITPNKCLTITHLAGLSLCNAIRDFTGLDCKIKWPNDIIIGNKKLAGILTEMKSSAGKIDYVIVGIGINVEQKIFPEEISHKATSIILETEKAIDKNDLFVHILETLEADFIRNNLEMTPSVLAEYTKLCATIGKTVTFSKGNESVCGKAVGIEQNGELIVTIDGGTSYAVGSGEVTVQGIY